VQRSGEPQRKTKSKKKKDTNLGNGKTPFNAPHVPRTLRSTGSPTCSGVRTGADRARRRGVMAEFVIETPEQAATHGDRLASITKLASRIFDISQGRVLDVETGTSPAAKSAFMQPLLVHSAVMPKPRCQHMGLPCQHIRISFFS